MPRVTEPEVSDVIETDLGTTQIEAFITSASVWVDDRLATSGQSASVLKEIEKYLACHFITLRDPRLMSAQAGDVVDKYQRDQNMTEYLKTAMALDGTGAVRDAFAAKQSVRWRVGTGYDT